MEERRHSFWNTLPGVLTGMGGVLTALAGLLAILYQVGYLGERTSAGDGAPTNEGGAEVQGTGTPQGGGPASDADQEAEEGFRVIEATLRAEPQSYTGECPVTIDFTGRISVVGGAGTVSYTFVRSDGASAPVESIHFTEPGSRDIETSWTLGGAGARINGWQAIHIFDPHEREYEHAAFSLNCLRTFEPGKLKLPGA